MADLKLEALRKVYDNGHVAVAGATFDIADGEFLVLVGPSGCGKSTLLRMIAGLESISSGTLAIGGRVVNDVAPKDRDIAMVFQSYALYPHMSVYDNLAFGLKLRDVPRAEVDRRVREAAQTLELASMLERKPGQLSGGQRQRVALGRALVRDPSVFLLDEPLSNLDARLRLGMRVELARLHRRVGTTMVYVTHDQIEAMTLGQRIVVMKDGEIQQIDTPMNLYAKPANLFVAGFLGSPAMNLLRGRVIDDGRPWLETGHARLPLDGTPELARLSRAARGELVAGLRPEDLAPAQADAPTSVLRAELDLVEPVGNEIFLNLRCGDDAIVARVPPQDLPAPGTTMTLAFDPARIHLFDATSGNRL
ncbi:MAG: sn-glycerol-3-phosphate ABC transporter ATP-binding protein UgpC [Xanthomonadales bacterium]|nr:sn-glycerol-3-phosphate ABC transporter ATP-binding protein UgpC [Xanthomonadales bacterium]